MRRSSSRPACSPRTEPNPVDKAAFITTFVATFLASNSHRERGFPRRRGEADYLTDPGWHPAADALQIAEAAWLAIERAADALKTGGPR